MQILFVNNLGKTFAPEYYAVYYNNNGNTFKRIENELNNYSFCKYAGVVKIELYQNGTSTSNPVLIGTLYREEISFKDFGNEERLSA